MLDNNGAKTWEILPKDTDHVARWHSHLATHLKAVLEKKKKKEKKNEKKRERKEMLAKHLAPKSFRANKGRDAGYGVQYSTVQQTLETVQYLEATLCTHWLAQATLFPPGKHSFAAARPLFFF